MINCNGSQDSSELDKLLVYLNMITKLRRRQTPSIVSFYLNSKGVGFSFFKSGHGHFYSRMMTTHRKDIEQSLFERMKEVILINCPKIILLPEYRKHLGGNKGERNTELIIRIAQYSERNGMKVHYYNRSDMRKTYSGFGIRTKYDIAQLICFWIPRLKVYMFDKRTAAKPEPYSSALFDSVSLVMTYLSSNATKL